MVKKMRPLKPEEFQLLKSITVGQIEIPENVRELNDGKMGSISFDLKNENLRFKSVVVAEYIDSDGVLVDIELTIDKKGNLFEFDFWKVNFEPLVLYPIFENIEIIKTKFQ